MPTELPNPPVDMSDLLLRIKNNCEAIAIRQTQARLQAYTEAVAARDKTFYKNWQQLSLAALQALDRKLIKELAAMPDEKPKVAIAPQVDKSKSNDDFF